MRRIDVRDLLEHPGSSRDVHVDEAVAGLSTELARVEEDTTVSGDLTLESIVEGVYVTGSVAGRMRLSCARCLKDFERDFDLEMHDLFVREAGPEDDYVLSPDLTLDPEPMVRDTVVLSMPFSPLCSQDCLGLCERCGGDRNLGECTCAESIDPRWAALERFTPQEP